LSVRDRFALDRASRAKPESGSVPTNKLWIEHTERAAWQSVDALRDKLADAERRLSRLAPPVEGWQALLDSVDTLRAEQKLAGETYADALRALVTELKQVTSRARELETELARTRETSPATFASAPSPRGRRFRGDDAPEEPSRGEERLSREIRVRHREFVRDRGRFNPSVVLADVESRLGELPDLDPAELFDAAADLAALALAVGRALPDED
jgi:hypothetical protein